MSSMHFCRRTAAVGLMIGLAACGAGTGSTPTPPPTPTSVSTSALANTPTLPPATPSSAPVCTSGSVGQSLCVDPATLAAGSVVRVSGYAPGCTSVTILSNAFPGPQQFAGVNAVTAAAPGGRFSATVTIPASTPAGSYPITVRACGGNLGVQLILTVG